MGVLSILAGLQELALRTLQELAKTTTACSKAMNALDAAKADRLELHAVTIPAAGWKKDDHGYYIDLNMPGLTADDSIAVLIEPDSADAAKAAVLDSTTQSSTDTLRLRAWKIPTADLHAHYYTIREDILMALGTVAMGVGNYVLPPATADTLGGIMIGDGLGVDETGKAAFAPAAMTTPTAKALSTKLAGEGLTVDENGKINLKETGALASYPVGSIYQSTDPTSPAALFGGSWQEIASERVLMGASSTHAAGTTVEAGLPNITATGGFYDNISVGDYGTRLTGAFYVNARDQTHTGYAGGNDTDNPTLDFDASRSNPIYGRSSTVQPAAYYVHIWHRVA